MSVFIQRFLINLGEASSVPTSDPSTSNRIETFLGNVGESLQFAGDVDEEGELYADEGLGGGLRDDSTSYDLRGDEVQGRTRV